MPLPLYHVDAFTDQAFTGNPAAVCLLESPMPDDWMQNVAAEMNLSETAFVHEFSIRWFTPATEVDICGHATLAAAHVLWESGAIPLDDTIPFSSRSGLLPAKREDDWICLDFPAEPATPCPIPKGLSDALGLEPVRTLKNRFDLLAEVENEAALEALTPDMRALAAVDCRGIIVTCTSETAGIDFRSRFFAPSAGIDEDPVTGSAHCALAPFWQERLGCDELTGYQCSARGGTVRVRAKGDRVDLLGKAVTTVRGVLVETSGSRILSP